MSKEKDKERNLVVNLEPIDRDELIKAYLETSDSVLFKEAGIIETPTCAKVDQSLIKNDK